MGYIMESRVRFSEAGETSKLTLPGILDYYQDCCTFQADSIHQGQADLLKRKRFWVTSAWQIDVMRYPKVGEYITVETRPYSLRGFLGQRNFVMKTAEGETLSVANSIWTYLNTETFAPERLREEDMEGYVLDEKLDMEYMPRRIHIPENCVEELAFPVLKQHLDCNHHVNNGQYVLMAEDYLPKNFTVHRMRAEYKHQAMLGDIVYPQVGVEETKVCVSLNNKEGAPFAIIEFS